MTGNGKTFQKIAEFNSDRKSYVNLEPEKLVPEISKLRNERIRFTENLHGIEKSIYHCVIRDLGSLKIYEEPLERIDLESIQGIKKNKGSISFRDVRNEYSFLLSKSTLTKRFTTDLVIDEFEVKIWDDPLLRLEPLSSLDDFSLSDASTTRETVYLPLYGRNYTVYPRSGLNQWNASGRARHPDEIYLPIPSEVHKRFPTFFPERDTPFMLLLPDGTRMKSKVCQDNKKALMSYSNRELGRWILRNVLNLKEGKTLTYEMLQDLGVDSVRIDKISRSEYEINFSRQESYELFKKNHLH